MYNLGIISSSIVAEDINELFEQNNWIISQLEKEDLYFDISKYDGFLIEEDDDLDVFSIYELILFLKNRANVYVWVISKDFSKLNRQIYLKLGVDANIDFINFPEEFLLYIVNSVERNQVNNKKFKLENHFNENGIHLDPNNRCIHVQCKMGNSKQIYLTKSEYSLLKVLHENMGETVSYEEIYYLIWNCHSKSNFYRIAILVNKIKTKLKSHQVNPEYIVNVRSKGYMLKV